MPPRSGPHAVLKIAAGAFALAAVAASDRAADADLAARGDDARFAGDYELALAWYEQALAANPDAPGALAGAASCLAARDEETALSFLAEAYTAPGVALPPAARAAMAEGWARRGDTAKALELLTFPGGLNEGALYFARGKILVAHGDARAAAADFMRARAEGERAAAYYAGEAFLAAGRPADAITVLTSFLAGYPYAAPAYDARGEAYYRQRDFDHAAADFRAALSYDRDDRRALFNLASLAAQKGADADALIKYGRVLELDPTDEETWRRVIAIYDRVDATVARGKREEYKRLFGKEG